ncbi:MAG: transposase, partial [Dehalococcoidia bacterium]|nr:transposase [Dehalococcoidia bacterium]
MPDFRRYPNEGFPYLVTTTVKGRQPLFVDRNYCLAFVSTITYLRTRLRHQVHAYVLMPDHAHLVVTPRADSSVSRLMHSLKLHTARQIGALSGSGGGIWQARFYERALRTPVDVMKAVAYVHDNPIKAGLANLPEEYVWSSYCSSALGEQGL